MVYYLLFVLRVSYTLPYRGVHHLCSSLFVQRRDQLELSILFYQLHREMVFVFFLLLDTML